MVSWGSLFCSIFEHVQQTKGGTHHVHRKKEMGCLALAVMITAFCLAVAGIMVLFAVLSPDAVMSIEMPLLYIMPGLLYSGLSWPDFYMSDVAAAIAQIFPMRHAADSVRDILLAGYAPALVSQSLQLLPGLLLWERPFLPCAAATA